MGKTGVKPKGKVEIKWSPNFAYAIGLLASDGCVSKDGRHILFTSKDLEQSKNFIKALGIQTVIGTVFASDRYGSRSATRVQFSDVRFWVFLNTIGLMPNKSKVIGAVQVPDEYFFDFLRGSFDGDGCTYSYLDKRWRSSFMFYTVFTSASQAHINWLRKKIHERLGIKGHITQNGSHVVYNLKYAKADSLKILREMYPRRRILCLGRKRLKIEKMLHTIGQRL